MDVTRDGIILRLTKVLDNDPDVLALWLEGADSNDKVDEFSDIAIRRKL